MHMILFVTLVNILIIIMKNKLNIE